MNKFISGCDNCDEGNIQSNGMENKRIEVTLFWSGKDSLRRLYVRLWVLEDRKGTITGGRNIRCKNLVCVGGLCGSRGEAWG